MSKGGGSTTTTQKSEPWSGLQPYLKDAYAQASNLYKSGGPEFYPNATYVPFSDQSNLGLELLTNRALQGSQFDQPAGWLANTMMLAGNKNTMDAADAFRGTAQGDYLNANPYLDAMYNQAAGKVTDSFNEGVMPAINATFGSAGRTGSGAHALATGRAAGELADTLGTMSSNLYGGNYQSERDRMMSAAGGLGNVAASDAQQRFQAANLGMGLGQQQYQDIGQLLNAGQMIEGKAGEVLGDSMNRFDYYQNRPEQNMNNYMAWLSGIPGAEFGTRTGKEKENGGLMGDIAQAVDLAAAIAALSRSDAALKTNVRKIGERHGFNWYRWDWNEKAAQIGLRGSAEGVIAQEVEKVRPDLVTTLNGYKAVYYGGL